MIRSSLLASLALFLACAPAEVDLLRAAADGGAFCSMQAATCGGPGTYCDLSTAASCQGIGICRELPPFGGDCGGPVCGCDGVSYDNACLAAAMHVAIRSAHGPCLDGVECDPETRPCDKPASCVLIGVARGCSMIQSTCYVLQSGPDPCARSSAWVRLCGGVRRGECVPLCEAVQLGLPFEGVPCGP